jgi:large subunit ribosomal protein L19e
MEFTQIKRLAADVMGVGRARVKIVQPTKVSQAMTRDDVRALIKNKMIIKKPIKGMSRVRARKRIIQKKKSRRSGPGSRKGAKGARTYKKGVWMTRVRALRRGLIKMKPNLQKGAYQKLYRMVKGGYFRSKGHLKLYVAENKLVK